MEFSHYYDYGTIGYHLIKCSSHNSTYKLNKVRYYVCMDTVVIQCTNSFDKLWNHGVLTLTHIGVFL